MWWRFWSGVEGVGLLGWLIVICVGKTEHSIHDQLGVFVCWISVRYLMRIVSLPDIV